MRLRVLTGILIFIVGIMGAFPVLSQQTCEDVLPPHMVVDEWGRVTDGAANNVRSEPALAGVLIGTMPGSSVFRVVGGPVCADGYYWWQAEQDGLVGWTAEANDFEYWTEPHPVRFYEDTRIGFMYAEYLASSVRLDMLGVETDIVGPMPPRFKYVFQDYGDTTPFDAVLYVVPIPSESDFIDNSLFWNSVYSIINLLNVNPPVNAENTPLDPLIFGAARDLVAQPHYVNMQNGRGVAFVTHYSQAEVPYLNSDLFYNFVGMSDDGQTLIIVQIPVDTYFLDEDIPANFDVTAFSEDIQSYRSEMTARFDAMPPQEWLPNLSTLDAIVQSINIKTQ